MRCSEIVRKTGETLVEIKLNIDGEGKSDIATGVGFLDHMLTLFAKHGLFDLTVKCKGDTEVDYHHTTEDVGIALGSAFEVALGAKRGINRYGDITLPMDDALVLSAVDLSGRAYYVGTFEIGKEKVGDSIRSLWMSFSTHFPRMLNAISISVCWRGRMLTT